MRTVKHPNPYTKFSSSRYDTIGPVSDCPDCKFFQARNPTSQIIHKDYGRHIIGPPGSK